MSTIVPVMIYYNAETDKSRIIADNKGKAGIYQWTHKESGRSYIGSSYYLSQRFYLYFSKTHLKHNKSMHICNALANYKYEEFSLTILEYIDITNLSLEEVRLLILLREQEYIDTLKPKFNICSTAGSRLGIKASAETKAKMKENHPRGMLGRSHSAETKAKISKAMSGENSSNFGLYFSAETRAKMSEAYKGKLNSEETKAKISKALTGENHPRGMEGRIHSAETKAKISKALTGKNNPNFGKSLSTETREKISITLTKKVFVYSFDPISNEMTLYKSFDNSTEATKFFNCSRRTLSNYIDKKKLYKKQWFLFTFDLGVSKIPI